MGQVWFGTKQKFKGLPILKPINQSHCLLSQFQEEKNAKGLGLALYKISVKELNEAGKVKLLYVYETWEFRQMLYPKHLNNFFSNTTFSLHLFCFKFCVLNLFIKKYMFLCTGLVWLCPFFFF